MRTTIQKIVVSIMTSRWQVLMIFVLPMFVGITYASIHAFNGTGSHTTNVLVFSLYTVYLMVFFTFNFYTWFLLSTDERAAIIGGPLSKVASLTIFHVLALLLVIMLFNTSIGMATMDKSKTYFTNLKGNPTDVARAFVFSLDLAAQGISIVAMDILGLQFSSLELDKSNLPFYVFCMSYRLFFSLLSLRVILSLNSILNWKPKKNETIIAP